MLKGQIYYVNLDGAKGSEQGGVRPCIVVQNDKGNKYSPTTQMAPITSRMTKAKLPTHIKIGSECGLAVDSIILLEQIRTVDRERIIDYVGKVDDKTMSKINKGIAISFGLEG